MFNAEQKKQLLTIARESIMEYLTGSPGVLISSLKTSAISPGLMERNGVFVTLHAKIPGVEQPVLRGCIGNVIGVDPLYQAVRRLAVESAVADPRFPPVRRVEELDTIDIEISVLTIPEKIDHYEKIAIGLDGIFLHAGGRSALFLPQVADEQGWNLEETLTHLSMKAGLSPEIWKDPECRFETFQAEVFSEEAMNG